MEAIPLEGSMILLQMEAATSRSPSNFARLIYVAHGWMHVYSNTQVLGSKVSKLVLAWSTGECDAKNNYGTFPLLPTQFIVARDVEISAEKDDLRLAAVFRSAVESTAEKLGHLGKNVMMVI